MNRSFIFLVLLGLSSALAGEAIPTAQQAAALVKNSITLPERAAWRVEYLPPKEGSQSPTGNIKEITSTRTGSVQRDILTWRGGEATEAWWINGDYLAEDPRTGNMLFTPAKKSLERLGWIAWVAEKNFQGVETHNGAKALVFRDEVPWLEYWPGFFTGDREGGSRTPLSAWFALDDGRLLGLKVGETSLKFSWLSPPAEELAVNVKFAEKQKKTRDRIAKKFPRPAAP